MKKEKIKNQRNKNRKEKKYNRKKKKKLRKKENEKNAELGRPTKRGIPASLTAMRPLRVCW